MLSDEEKNMTLLQFTRAVKAEVVIPRELNRFVETWYYAQYSVADVVERIKKESGLDV
jgi:hypothetical protein